MRDFGETGHGEAAVPVEVGPERDQPDQPGRAGEMGVYPSGGGTESRLCESDITDFMITGRKDRTLGMLCTPVMVQVAATGKWKATETEKADVGKSTDEALEARTRSAAARPRLPMAMAAAPKPPKVRPH